MTIRNLLRGSLVAAGVAAAMTGTFSRSGAAVQTNSCSYYCWVCQTMAGHYVIEVEDPGQNAESPDGEHSCEGASSCSAHACHE